MHIAMIGGTHGNEPVGIEVMNYFLNNKKDFLNSYETFLGNPKAYELKRRYVDTDLNRAFGKNGIRKGYEKKRAEELEAAVQADFSIDLHTTTANMGLNIILNNTHRTTQKLCAYLKSKWPEINLIEEDRLDEDCNHLNRLCPGGVTVEVGPVANNVLNAELVLATRKIVELILNYDFATNVDCSQVEHFKYIESVCFPAEGDWYVHPDLEQADYKPITKESKIFINIEGDEITFDRDEVMYPFFVNEAAYLENRSAFLLAVKKQAFTISSQS